MSTHQQLSSEQLPPFVPADNIHTPIIASECNKKLDTEETYEYLCVVETYLSHLLNLSDSLFSACVDRSIVEFIKSFLMGVSRWYDLPTAGCGASKSTSLDLAPVPFDSSELVGSITGKVFYVITRLITQLSVGGDGTQQATKVIGRVREAQSEGAWGGKGGSGGGGDGGNGGEFDELLTPDLAIALAAVYADMDSKLVSALFISIIERQSNEELWVSMMCDAISRRLYRIRQANLSSKSKRSESSEVAQLIAGVAEVRAFVMVINCLAEVKGLIERKGIGVVCQWGVVVDKLVRKLMGVSEVIEVGRRSLGSDGESEGGAALTVLSRLFTSLAKITDKSKGVEEREVISEVMSEVSCCHRITALAIVEVTRLTIPRSEVSEVNEVEQASEMLEPFLSFAIDLCSTLETEQRSPLEHCRCLLHASGMDEVLKEWSQCAAVDQDKLGCLKQLLTPRSPPASLSAHPVTSAQTVSSVTPLHTSGSSALLKSISHKQMLEGVNAVSEVMSEYGKGFIWRCLNHFNFNVNSTLNCLLEETSLPASLTSLNKDERLEEVDICLRPLLGVSDDKVTSQWKVPGESLASSVVALPKLPKATVVLRKAIEVDERWEGRELVMGGLLNEEKDTINKLVFTQQQADLAALKALKRSECEFEDNDSLLSAEDLIMDGPGLNESESDSSEEVSRSGDGLGSGQAPSQAASGGVVESESEGESGERVWSNNRARGGRVAGAGRGGRGRGGAVRGGTIQARRKTEKNAHNRKNAHSQKMSRGPYQSG
eukprot:GHVN01098162.1.p1 GENE.GHVN01098162.1~~GHVN01098162.1.p1  ORF type:complete len:773 (+),score=237.23 GHVN01098162.1:57-2375(+)